MKRFQSLIIENALLLTLALIYAFFIYYRSLSSHPHVAVPSFLSRLFVEGKISYYACSDTNTTVREGLPVIICIGDRFVRPDLLTNLTCSLGEPVLIIWCDMLSGLPDDTRVDDQRVWEQTRDEFGNLLSQYQRMFHFDEERVYLTGIGFTGVYAWMLAYDKPERYAGMVAMSAVSSPRQIQEKMQDGKNVVTVVVWGEKSRWYQQRQTEEKQTGRVIESLNPHSRFLIKPIVTGEEIVKYWKESIQYVLHFRKAPSPLLR